MPTEIEQMFFQMLENKSREELIVIAEDLQKKILSQNLHTQEVRESMKIVIDVYKWMVIRRNKALRNVLHTCCSSERYAVVQELFAKEEQLEKESLAVRIDEEEEYKKISKSRFKILIGEK